MRLNTLKVGKAFLLTLLASSAAYAQNMRVDVGKHNTPIPKDCESVVPASIDPLDIPALAREANCKGAGDLLIEYTYVMNASTRTKDKKGKTKEESTTYEVFIPTLKSGTHTRGILLVTSRNGVPVPPVELEKDRLRAGEHLEEQEKKIAGSKPTASPAGADSVKGMLPLGMYARTGINRTAFGMNRGSVVLDVQTFLKTCDLTFVRREQSNGRDTLVFSFAPRADAHFNDNEKYVAQLNGEIWIDAQDRIVSRLEARPKKALGTAGEPSSGEPPAVFVEMMRLRDGVWLPHLVRLNGVDYPTLFDRITSDHNWVYSDYIHFSTEIKDTKVGAPDK